MPDNQKPLTSEMFSEIMASGFADVGEAAALAVAAGVSGGPDSMALAGLLSGWAQQNGKDIRALVVDHGLRPESAQEAAQTYAALKEMPRVQPTILKWEDEKPGVSIQEEARRARYTLMGEYCRAHGIAHLFLAHHMDDQAETFLFRLAKGSGLDGLAAMQRLQEADGVTLCRPLLGVAKARLVAFCERQKLTYAQDPSNDSDSFARVRMRRSMDALAEEGLTPKRLATTSMRLRRARNALEMLAEQAFAKNLLEKNTDRVVLNNSGVADLPEELALRVVLTAVNFLRPEADYAPRMEKIEELVTDLCRQDSFRKRTLGGLVFERDDKSGHVVITKES